MVLRAKTEFVPRPLGRADLLRASHRTGLMHRLWAAGQTPHVLRPYTKRAVLS